MGGVFTPGCSYLIPASSVRVLRLVVSPDVPDLSTGRDRPVNDEEAEMSLYYNKGEWILIRRHEDHATWEVVNVRRVNQLLRQRVRLIEVVE